MQEDEGPNLEAEELPVVRTRTGCEVKRPRKYQNSFDSNSNYGNKFACTVFVHFFPFKIEKVNFV